jgi:hypothetical protein
LFLQFFYSYGLWPLFPFHFTLYASGAKSGSIQWLECTSQISTPDFPCLGALLLWFFDFVVLFDAMVIFGSRDALCFIRLSKCFKVHVASDNQLKSYKILWSCVWIICSNIFSILMFWENHLLRRSH